MRITFVFAGQPRVPIGGFAVAYEYANRLSRLGHQVTVVHRRGWATGRSPLHQLASEGRGLVRGLLSPIPAAGRPAWYEVHDSVQSRLVATLRPDSVPDGDVVIATSWEVVGRVFTYPPRKGAKLNLIQHYETWAAPEALLREVWQLPMHKVVISRWLRDLARGLGEESRTTYIPNGLDFGRFRVVKPVEDRVDGRVGMLYHQAQWKGTDDGIAALSLAHISVPEIDAVLFGTDPQPRLPPWVDYVHAPIGEQLVELYNSLAVFVHPSWAEGWPLPPAEAMASGCALAAAANDGVSDYADGGTAILTPVRDPQRLAQSIVTLVRDRERRIAIARAGNMAIQQYTWERACSLLEALLLRLCAGQVLP